MKPNDDESGSRYDIPADMYDVTSTHIVQRQTKKRLNQTYRMQQAQEKWERRIGICIAVCAGILFTCVMAAQIYGAWKR